MRNLCIVACVALTYLVVANAQPSERIVGGIDATEGQFPHQVSLRYGGSHICGGSIISPNYILTAAHCVGSEDSNGIFLADDPRFFTIRAGSTNHLINGVVKQVVEITVHEGFGNFLNDMALLKLASPLIYSANVRSIALASSEVPAGSKVIVSGWGRLSTHGAIPDNLQYTTLEAISKLNCLLSISMFSDALICLAHNVGNGACSGDSGGPAIYNGKLVGVAGFVVGGCGSNYPDGYAKVFYHLKWIKKHSDL